MKKPSGFTLVELILASVIMTIIGTLTWGALSATFKTERTMSERTVLQEIGTAALAKLRDDISQAFIVEAPRQITYFTGDNATDQAKLAFTTFSHTRSGPNTHESDQTIVSYDTQNDPAGGRFKVLRRSENRYLTSDKNDIADTVVVATNVVSMRFEFNDGQEFKSVWDSKSIDQRNKLPKAVRIVLKLADEKEREENFEAMVEIPMSDALGIDKNQAGTGGAGGSGGQTGAAGQASGSAASSPTPTPSTFQGRQVR